MKVFTVGLDQKPPLKEGMDSPPPGYSSNATAIPMGTETPLIIHKSKSYKGILLGMLAVFLIAVFALTLSEISYNRQRDENFFRLRWAELKHRMGYDSGLAAERLYTLRRAHEVQAEALAAPAPTTTTTQAPPALVDSSVEKSSGADRLAFFKRLLESIKKQAEEMGFDGTMQVSVVQVDPEQLRQAAEEHESNMDGFGEWHMPQQQQQQQNGERNWHFEDDYNGEMEQPQATHLFRPRWQQPNLDRWSPNRVDNFFFPQQPQPFWWQQQQNAQAQQMSPSNFLSQQAQEPMRPQQHPQFIFFPDHNINQFQQPQVPFEQRLPQPNFQAGQQSFVLPEDRVQIEPPTPEQMNRWKAASQMKPFDFKAANNDVPKGWTHNEDAFVQPPALPSPVINTFLNQAGPMSVKGMPEEPKPWENMQPAPALSIDPVPEPLVWANSLETETPFAEIIPEEESKEHEAQSAPHIEQEPLHKQSHELPMQEVAPAKLSASSPDQHAVNDDALAGKEPEPIEVDFPAVKFPLSDEKQPSNPIFFQVDEPQAMEK